MTAAIFAKERLWCVAVLGLSALETWKLDTTPIFQFQPIRGPSYFYVLLQNIISL